jgi:GDPmannose 4,6-dehydratase
MQWRILQQKKPEDFVVATGNAYSVKQFIETCTKILEMKIIWQGKGINEKAYLVNPNKKKELLIKVDKKYFRPNEVHYLKGDARKAFKKLKFKPKFTFQKLVEDMIKHDL